MVTLTIDNKEICVPENTTILEAAKSANILIPNMCYLKGINEIAACRLCVVEIEGYGRLTPACNNAVSEGMVIKTNSPKVRRSRRTTLSLLLSQHDSNCPVCVRSGNCTLQKIANDFNTYEEKYPKKVLEREWDKKAPLIRDESKCVKCMRCIQICSKVQGVDVWDVSGTGCRTTVGVSRNRAIDSTECTYCGQCITHCPVGALHERDDTSRVMRAINNPDVITVVQVAPAVRAAWGEELGLSREEATSEKMVGALKALGFDYVFDTNFSADLTIMEEGSELIARLKNRGHSALPLMTSCCPGWVRFVKTQYPQFLPNLSTAKSPQQMFGAIAKSYFANKAEIAPEKLFVVSVMPCVSKKSECEIPNMNDACGKPDVDASLTTREMVRLFRSEHIAADTVENAQFDSPLGTSTGAAVVFGTTGGVMDAALRSGYFLLTGENPPADAFKTVRGSEGIKEASFEIPGVGPLRVAVVSGLGRARELLEEIEVGRAIYDFIEIMACPGGCAGGGGQPIHDGFELAGERGERLWELDRASEIRFSHENPEVGALYSEFLGVPLGATSHHLLHTEHGDWQMKVSVQ